MSFRRAAIFAGGILGAIVLIGMGAVALLVTVDLRPLAERQASRALDRPVTIDALDIGWGDPLEVEISGLRVANMAWGQAPEIIRIGRLSAAVDVAALLGGVLHYRKLEIADAAVHLERNADGAGNWRFGGAGTPGSSDLQIIPKNRGQFPLLPDFALREGVVTYRTSSGDVIPIDLTDLTIRSTGDDQPVALRLQGAYNGVPTRLTADTASFTRLRDRSAPFPAAFSITAEPVAIAFDGTIGEPLDFEGVEGGIEFDVRSIGAFFGIFDAELAADFPLLLGGELHRDGDDWKLSGADGKLGSSAFDGSLALKEGGRGGADAASLALGFARLELGEFVGEKNGGGYLDLPLRPGDIEGIAIDAQIEAERMDVGSATLGDVILNTRVASDRTALDRLSFAFAGGSFEFSGTSRAEKAGDRLDLTIVVTDVDAVRVAQLIGGEGDQIVGHLDGRAILSMFGRTVGEALERSRGQAVLSMTEGRVSRALIERASSDLRTLFRTREGAVRIDCLLAVIELRDGVALATPLRMRTAEGTLAGGGRIDILDERLDLVLATDPDSTGLFALDVPFRISGAFDAIGVEAASGQGPAGQASAGGSLRQLPPPLQELAAATDCRP